MKIIKFLFFCIAGTTLVLTSCKTQTIENTKIKTEVDSVCYALGINMAQHLQTMEIPDLNLHAIAKGIQDGLSAKEDIMTNQDAIIILNSYFMKIQQQASKANLDAGNKFLEENATKEGVVVDESGLQYKVLVEGTGAMPVETDKVRVHYRGTLIDGTEFDSSFKNDKPAEFKLNQVIRGWTIGLQKMKVGSKYMLYIPSDLGYGERVRQGGPIKPNSVLIFEVELLDILKE